MHESTLAKQLLAAVLERAESAGATRVRKVSGWLAETEALDPQAAQFHFNAVARGTVAEGAELALALTHVEARCADCAHVYKPEHHLTLCPECGSVEAALLGPTGMGVDSIDIDSA